MEGERLTMSTMAAAPEPKRVFRVRDPLPLLRPAFLACVVAFGVVFFVMEGEHRWTISAILGGVLLFALALCYWLMTITRLEMTRDAVIYHAIGYRVRSSWGNVAGVGRRLQGAVDLDCLILREPGMELSWWMRLTYQILPLINIAALVSGQGYVPNQLNQYSGVIPVEMFDKQWYSGDIGRLIKQYAPKAYETAL